MAEKYTNIGIIMDRISRHPMLKDIPFETMVDYTIDFIQVVGCPAMFEEKTAALHIQDYRALLPCDYVNMIQVRCRHPEWPQSRRFLTYRYSTDSFHMSHDLKRHAPDIHIDLTYKIQGCMIYTSTREGDIEIAYEAIATDAEGLPLVPDNPAFFKALEGYIKKQWFTILFDMGKIQGPTLQRASQDYAWAVGQCESEFHRLSLDKAESFFNSWKTLLERDTEHWRGFITNGSKEITPLTGLPNAGYGVSTMIGKKSHKLEIIERNDGDSTPEPEDTLYPPIFSCDDNTVSMSCITPGAIIMFRTDDDTNWYQYTFEIPIYADTVFYAYSQLNGQKSNTVTYEAKYKGEDEPAVSKPTYRVTNNRVYLSSVSGATIYFRVYGQQTWSVYSQPIPISENTTFEAYASLDGTNSDILKFTATYSDDTPSEQTLSNPMYYGGGDTEIPVNAQTSSAISGFSLSDKFITTMACDKLYYYLAIPPTYTISKITGELDWEITEDFNNKGTFTHNNMTYTLYEFHIALPLEADITVTLRKI